MKGARIGILISLAAFLLFSGNAWAVLQCSDSPAFGGTEILRLSAADNAHGEFPSPLIANNYTLAIRCKETGGTVLSVTNGAANPFIHLSDTTNAHAEITGLVNYTNVLSLTSATGSISIQVAGPVPFAHPTCDGYDGTIDYTEIVRLSDTTNAHLESPYSGTPAQEYPYSICGGYSSSVIPPSYPDILAVTVTGTPGTTTTTSPAFNAVITTSKLPTDPNFTNTRTLLIVSVCDLIDPLCASATDALQYGTDLYIDPATTAATFKNREAVHYGSAIAPYTLIPQANWPITAANLKVPIGGNMEFQTPAGTGVYNYSIDPAALGFIDGHTYRVAALALTGQFDHAIDGVDKSEGVPTETLTNFQYQDILVDNSSSGGGGTGNNGGDVFILKSIDFDPNPPIEGADFGATIVVQNKNTTLTTSGKMDIIIRNGDGVPVVGITSPTCPQCFAADQPLDFSSEDEITITLPIELASTPNANLVPGQTYTLYASAQPYVDSTPLPTDDSETVVGNNAVFKTFAILNPQDTVNVPDAPWWMSIVMVGMVLGWLFASSRKEDKE